MSENLSDKIATLSQLNLRFRQQLEQAELHIPQINQQIQALAALGVNDRLAIEGNVVVQLPYLPNVGRDDSCQIYVAALIVPEGLGVAVLDLEDYLVRQRDPNSEITLAARFQAFDESSSFVKAALLPQVESLVSRFLLSLGI